MTQSAAAFDAAIGIGRFQTATEGIGGTLKSDPEDFIVVERSCMPERVAGGQYLAATVTARNWETNHLVKMIAKRLHISRRRIFFAGTKDKRAVTTQLMVFDVDEASLSALKIRDVTFDDIYPVKRPIEIGDLIGNAFSITARNIALPADETRRRIEATLAGLGGTFPNFFGGQRFGTVRPITHHVGKYIAQGRFEDAVWCYAANPMASENAPEYDARSFLAETHDVKEALPRYPKHLIFERAMLSHLSAHPGDYVGAIRVLPYNLMTMFVYAYQSYLFNKIITERMNRGFSLTAPLSGDIVLPADARNLPTETYIPVTERNIKKVEKQLSAGKAHLSGIVFGSEPVFADGEQGAIEHDIIDAEGLRPKDFVIPAMPELTSRGLRRMLAAPVSDLSYTVEADDTGTAAHFSFTLQKGTYATSFLRELMKAPTISY